MKAQRMKASRLIGGAVLVTMIAGLVGCAVPAKPQRDYSAFKASNPKSILVLPPVNESPDIDATYSVFSQVTYPLAESGYYVMPVTLVGETFRQNGLTSPAEIHAVAPGKLQEIFGADAGLYITITKYGSVYTILDSVVVVTANARLVDLKTGTELWSGSASANSNEGKNNNSSGLAAILISAVVKQILNNVNDTSYPVAGMTTQRLLSAGQPNGLLYGPRSPRYGQEGLKP